MNRVKFNEIGSHWFEEIGYDYVNDSGYYQYFVNAETGIKLMITKRGSWGVYAQFQLVYENTSLGFDLRTEKTDLKSLDGILRHERRLKKLITYLKEYEE